MSLRMFSAAVVGLVTALLVATAPAQAQAVNAEEACTPDVMRLCQDFVPERDKIVSCLKSKRRQLSKDCRAVFSSKGKRRHRRG